MNITLRDVRHAAGFLGGLPALLRNPVTLDAARTTLRQRLDEREATFLALVRRGVFAHPTSPYRPLLQRAGCEYGDVEQLVRRDGIEGALRTLLRNGVYLRSAELKGLRDILRGDLALRPTEGQFQNPAAAAHIPGQSSGSRGARFSVPLDLAFVRARSVDYALIAAHLLPARTVHGVWKTPGGDVLDNLLCFAGFGAVAERWFLQVDPATPGLHPAYRWSIQALRGGSRLIGARFPRPEVVRFEDPVPIAQWLAATRQTGAAAHLQLFCSAAVRLCEAAGAAGLDLAGSWFMVGGEPLTSARATTIRAAGVTPLPRYGTAEAPSIAVGCSRGPTPDAVHLLSDLYAVIQSDPAPPASDLPPDALFITSLCPTSPLVLLNVSLGDRGVLGPATCGCPLSALGWTTRLHSVRSFEKLTAGGMMFLDSDVIRILEEVLPARFGGGPTDYQIAEDETVNGHASVRLLVHPRVPITSLETVRQTFLETLGKESGTARVMGLVWQDAGLVTVERRAPVMTASGKVLHLRAGPAPLAASPGRRA